MSSPEVDVSAEISHYRDLQAQGKISREDAYLVTDWIQMVHGLAMKTGRHFAEIATFVPAPLPWRGFISLDGDINAPKIFGVSEDGIELEF